MSQEMGRHLSLNRKTGSRGDAENAKEGENMIQLSEITGAIGDTSVNMNRAIGRSIHNLLSSPHLRVNQGQTGGSGTKE